MCSGTEKLFTSTERRTKFRADMSWKLTRYGTKIMKSRAKSSHDSEQKYPKMRKLPEITERRSKSRAKSERTRRQSIQKQKTSGQTPNKKSKVARNQVMAWNKIGMKTKSRAKLSWRVIECETKMIKSRAKLSWRVIECETKMIKSRAKLSWRVIECGTKNDEKSREIILKSDWMWNKDDKKSRETILKSDWMWNKEWWEIARNYLEEWLNVEQRMMKFRAKSEQTRRQSIQKRKKFWTNTEQEI